MDKYIDKISTLEIELNESREKLKDIENKLAKSADNLTEDIKIKIIENERDNLASTLTKLKQDSLKVFKDRTPKKVSEFTSKSQLKSMVNELENEIGIEICTSIFNTILTIIFRRNFSSIKQF